MAFRPDAGFPDGHVFLRLTVPWAYLFSGIDGSVKTPSADWLG